MDFLILLLVMAIAGSISISGESGSSCRIPVTLDSAVLREPVLPNGRFGPGEWDDAASTQVGEHFCLYLKHDQRFVYIGIRFLGEMHTGVDLFLCGDRGNPLKLHVSAAIGQAEWREGTWSEIRWGANASWTANSIGLIHVDGERRVVPLEGFEFQISRSLCPGSTWSFMIHLKRPAIVFPAAADPQNLGHWAVLRV